MTGIDSYMNTYLDRRMKFIISDWELATRIDSADLEERLRNLENDITSLGDFEKMADGKLSEMETRIGKLMEVRR
jgi:hypothetical protein